MAQQTEPSLRAVAPGVFAYIQPDGSWWLDNVGAIESDGVITVVDSCATAARTRAFIAALERVTDGRVSTVINTHEHSDHSNGNALFAAPMVIAHENARAAMDRRGISDGLPHFAPIDVSGLVPALPTVTFSDRLSLWTGNVYSELIAAPTPAHTAGDCVVWLPEQSVLFCGDLVFSGVTPLLMAGSILGTIETLRQTLIPLCPAVVIPGHGEIGDRALLQDMLEYCELVMGLASVALREGTSALEAARHADVGRFAIWLDGERLVANLHRAMADLRGVPRGARLDYDRVMADVRDLRGGGPIITLV